MTSTLLLYGLLAAWLAYRLFFLLDC